ncbi:MAG: hypothetical protein RLY78_1971 [Pseudomonadota bacterium]
MSPAAPRATDPALTPEFSLRRYGPQQQAHAHGHAQLLWALDGALDLEIDGHAWRLAAGQGLVIAPGEWHAYGAEAVSRCLVLDTPEGGWPARGTRPMAAGPLRQLLGHVADRLQAGRPLAHGAAALLLREACADAGPGPAGAVATVGGAVGLAPRAARPVDWDGLGQWLSQRLAAPLQAQDLARRAGLGTSQLRARCLAERGCTPMQWVRALRLQQARRWRADGLSVAETARRVGYESPAALTAALRREAALHRETAGSAGIAMAAVGDIAPLDPFDAAAAFDALDAHAPANRGR